MTVQTIDEMVAAGADLTEATNAKGLFDLLKPGLKVKRNGRIETAAGDKTILGLYRTVGSQIFA